MAAKTPAPSADRVRRRVAYVVAAVVALVGAYELAMNAFLGTRLFRDLASSNPDSLLVDYASATSLWPGHAHVKGLRIRGKDSNVEWQLEIDDGVLDVSVLDLLHKRFRVERVHGDGVAFVLRRRLEPGAVTRGKLARIPEVQGLEAVPVRPPPTPPPTDTEYHLWTVELDDVIADHTREIWVDDLHFRGDAQVRGGFYLKPIRFVTVDPSTMEIAHGEIAIGKETLVRGVTGRFDYAMDGFDPRVTTGKNVLEKIAAGLHASGEVTSLAPVAQELEGSGVTLEGGGGPVRVAVRLTRGAFDAGSEASVSVADANVRRDEWSVALSGDVKLAVNERGTDVSAAVAPVVVTRRGLEDDPLRVASASLAFHTDSRDPREPIAAPVVAADVTGASLASLRAVDALLPKGGDVHVAGGSATASAHLDFVGTTAAGDARLALRGAEVRASGHDVRGDVDVHVHLRSFHEGSGRVDLGGSAVSLRNVSDGDDRGWWANVDFPWAIVDTRGPKPSVAFGASTRMRDGAPILEEIARRTPLPRWAPDVVHTDGLEASLEARLAPPRITLHDLRAHGGALDVRGDLTKDGPHQDGAFLVSWGPLSFGLDLRDDGSKPVLVDPTGWFARRTGAPPPRSPTASRAPR